MDDKYMVQKDLNLFSVYKRSASMAGDGFKTIIIIVATLLFIVTSVYGTLLIFNFSMDYRIKNIEAELADPSVAKSQKDIGTQVEKNSLMAKYKTALGLAEKEYGKSLVIDSVLFKSITDSMPQSVVMSGILITPTNITMGCSSGKDFLAAAAFTQALNATKKFKSVSYSAINKDNQKGYTFTITCSLSNAEVK